MDGLVYAFMSTLSPVRPCPRERSPTVTGFADAVLRWLRQASLTARQDLSGHKCREQLVPDAGIVNGCRIEVDQCQDDSRIP
jgi:hypothetical protein